jgi:hypothetical protein
MDSEKAPTRHVPSGIGNEPEERRHHNLRLDQLGAIEARFVRDHRGVGDPAGDEDVHRDAGAVEVLRHDCASASSAALEGP